MLLCWCKYKNAKEQKQTNDFLINIVKDFPDITTSRIDSNSITAAPIINDEFDLSNDVRTGLEWALAPAKDQ
jgi:hypothetical protein